MFISFEYIDDFSLTGATKSKRISVFSVGSVEPGKKGCKLYLIGKEFSYKLLEAAAEFEARCNEALQAAMPAPIAPPSFDPPAPAPDSGEDNPAPTPQKDDTIIFDVIAKEDGETEDKFI